MGEARTSFAPDDDNELLIGLADGRLLRLDRASGTPDLLGFHDRRISTVAYSIDGKWMLSAGNDGVTKVWARHGELFVELPHGGVVHAAAFSPDGRHVLTGSSNRTARVWPVTDAELQHLARVLPYRGLEPEEKLRIGGR